MARVSFQVPFACGSGQWHGITYPGHSQWAVDFNRGWGDSDRGAAVLCSLDGEVYAIEAAYGGVKVRHPNGYSSWYFHLERIRVRVGQRVVTFQQLGEVGKTFPKPRILSAHLHYEQRRYDAAIPMRFNGVRYPVSLATVGHVTYGPLIAGKCP